jgi:hypothetical protein
MTIERPMFPPRADQKNAAETAAFFSTCSATAPVETCSSTEQVFENCAPLTEQFFAPPENPTEP